MHLFDLIWADAQWTVRACDQHCAFNLLLQFLKRRGETPQVVIAAKGALVVHTTGHAAMVVPWNRNN